MDQTEKKQITSSTAVQEGVKDNGVHTIRSLINVFQTVRLNDSLGMMMPGYTWAESETLKDIWLGSPEEQRSSLSHLGTLKEEPTKTKWPMQNILLEKGSRKSIGQY